MVGPISFLGLIIANISRQLLKTYRHTQLIAGAALMGVIALIGGQFIVERVFVYSIPISVFITVDLPAPLGPMSDVTFPFGSKKLTSLTTVFSSYFFIIWLIFQDNC